MMKKLIPGIALALLLLIAIISLITSGSRTKATSVAKSLEKEAIQKITQVDTEARAALQRSSANVKTKAKAAEVTKVEAPTDTEAVGTGIRDSLASLFGNSPAKSNEVSIPLTVKLAKDGKSWKLSGIELAGADGSESCATGSTPVDAAALAAREASLVEQIKSDAQAELQAANAFAVYFLPSSATLGPVGSAEVKNIVDQVKKVSPKKVVLRGYADTTGSDQGANVVAAGRAESVQKALAEAGISPEQIVIERVGASPDGETAAQKRRVEVALVTQ